MPLFSSLQIPPPANWQDFEDLCCDLWREIWKDPNTQKNGRQGQPQHGVDVYGSPDQQAKLAGVQCKGKDYFADKSLTEEEVKTEVEKAKSFQPKLSQFIIATTGPKDAKLQELARKITEEHCKKDLFSVHIFGWNDIIDRLADYPKLIEKHYREFGIDTKTSAKRIDELKEIQQKILEKEEVIIKEFTTLPEKINMTPRFNHADLSIIVLTHEYQAELDHSKDLLNNYKTKEALEFLEKLKSRIWPNAQPIVKYRLLTYIGSAKLSLHQHKESAKIFLEALQYNPKDEKALCNAALGYMLIGQTKEAEKYANKVLVKNPANNLAYSIIIQISSDDEKIEDIIEKVPEPYRTTPEVAYAISYLLYKKNKLLESQKWLETAVENDKEDSPDLKGALGEVLIELVLKDQSTIFGIQLSDENKKQIHESIELLTSAWNRTYDEDLKKLRLSWIVNRGIAKSILGNKIEANKDAEIALELEPSDPILVKNIAFLFYESGDNEKAITLLKGIISAKDTPKVTLRLAEVLRKESKFLEAISIINEFLDSNPPKSLKEEANRLLIQLYIDTNDFENARKISDSMRASYPTNILYLVDAARISRFSGQNTSAITLLNEAKNYITKTTSFSQLLEIANEFYALEKFEDAASIYGKFVDKTLNTSLTHKLLNSYYQAGEIGESLEICQILSQNYGPLKYVSEMESAIYEEIGNLPEAKRVCQEYISLFPDDFGMELRLAVLNFRSENFEELDKFLNSYVDIDIDTLSLEYGIRLAYLYGARKQVKKSFKIMYEIRRKFFHNSKAHLAYIGHLFQQVRVFYGWLNIREVSVDAAVCIEGDLGQRDWYIIENRKDADMQRREINLDHPLAQRMLGKSIDDEILLKESDLSREYGKIVQIKSKYVHAHHESLSLFEKLFPGTPGIWGVKVEESEKKLDIPKGIQTILDEISRQHNVQQQVEQFYREGKLPIGAFANLIGRDVLDIWGDIIINPDLGIKCCLGNVEERKHAISLLKNKPKLIVDIISLLTLHDINAIDIIIRAFGKLGIAQSTIDLLQSTINERKGIQSEGFMTIGKEGDKFVRQEISAQNVKCNIEHLTNILHWIENNCEIIPCRAALDMKRDSRQKLNEMIGPSFIDTILIASDLKSLLFSDDERLRFFAKAAFNVDGVWTQIALMYCLNINILEKSKYNEMIVKLTWHHYYHTSINADVLIEAARQSKWSPSPPYTIVLQVLRGKYSDTISALIVGTSFLYELWKQQILVHQRDNLINSLLDAITAERNRREILDKLILHVKRKFYLLPLAERQILSLINLWKLMHII